MLSVSFTPFLRSTLKNSAVRLIAIPGESAAQPSRQRRISRPLRWGALNEAMRVIYLRRVQDFPDPSLAIHAAVRPQPKDAQGLFKRTTMRPPHLCAST